MQHMRAVTVWYGVLLAAGTAANADVLFVQASCGGGLADGSSWANAFCGADGLHQALAASQPGDQVWIGVGTYTPAPAGGSRDASFIIPPGVAVYGGFSGVEADLEDRNITLFPAVLSGDLNGDDTHTTSPYPGNANENVYQVVRISNATPGVLLDGVTILSGFAFGGQVTRQDRGGNIFIDGGEVTLRDCTLRYGYASRAGGAIAATNANLSIENCLFHANGCNSFGAGLAVLDGSNAVVSDTVFLANLGGRGTGLYAGPLNFTAIPDPQPCVEIRRCVFRDAVGPFGGSSGGGIMVIRSRVLVSETDFINNEVPGGGGAIYTISNDVRVVSCRFVRNRAPGDGGGAIYADGDRGNLSTETSYAPEFTNCVFTGNNGVAVCNFSGSLRLANCTLANNTINDPFPTWPALMSHGDSALSLHNSILWNNDPSATTLQGRDFFLSGEAAQHLDVRSCLVEGWNGSIPGDAFHANPLFVGANGADGMPGTNDDLFILSAGSPAVDAGDNTLMPLDAADLDEDLNTSEPTPMDIARHARFTDQPSAPDTGNGLAPFTDLGAYEWRCASDLTGDGSLDFFDVSAFLAGFNEESPTSDFAAPFGQWDFFDIAGYLASFAAGCP